MAFVTTTTAITDWTKSVCGEEHVAHWTGPEDGCDDDSYIGFFPNGAIAEITQLGPRYANGLKMAIEASGVSGARVSMFGLDGNDGMVFATVLTVPSEADLERVLDALPNADDLPASADCWREVPAT